jgi:Asp-tRNA(Asn)/Glu-tRNA(Gln) amidotransferase A subunit family amidase
MPTTYGSMIFQNFMSERDATIVSRLKAAGAIILGKATMGEFASGYVGSAHGICRNVYAVDRNPSGSSCGSGIAVASNFATVAIGEDTGGSIRGPAAHTSTVGLRPTMGLISRFGMMPANPSRDTLGPIARTVRDAAILADVLAGFDPNDVITAYSVGHVPPTYKAFLELSALEGARLGVIRVPMDANAEPKSEDFKRVREVIDRAIEDMKALGAEVVDPIEIPGLLELIGEVGSNHEAEAAINVYLSQLTSPPVSSLRDIAVSDLVTPRRRYGFLGALNRSTDDVEHLRSVASREKLRLLILEIMASHDLDALVYSTFDHSPAIIPDDVLTNPEAEDEYGKGSNRNLSPALGFPALTVPAGFTSEGLPVGLEFLARPFAEGTILGLAYAYEQATHRRRPPPLAPPL